MGLISLKDYAAMHNISYEAVRQQVVRYADDLQGHIVKNGRQQLLDDVAVAFLDEKRQKNPVSIIQMDKDQEIEDLHRENENLLRKIAVQADKIAELAQWKADQAVLIAEATHKQLLLDEKAKELDILEDSLKESERRLQEAKERADQLQKRLHEEENRPLSLIERITGKKK